MGSLWNNVLIKQSAGLKQLWSEVKAGNYKHENALKTWAGAYEDAYEVFVDAWRGPGYITRPAWLYLSYSGKTKAVLEKSIRLDRTESAAMTPDKTDFARLDEGTGHGEGPNFLRAADMYQTCSVKGNEVQIVLRMALLETLKGKPQYNGQYISFVFGQNRGPEPPLVIVVLRISDLES